MGAGGLAGLGWTALCGAVLWKARGLLAAGAGVVDVQPRPKHTDSIRRGSRADWVLFCL